MGTTGTYLFIPFILLVIGFFVFLFYQVTKSDTEMKKQKNSVTRSAQIGRGKAGGESASERASKPKENDSTKSSGES